ncbi:MAG: PIN domain nuclease [Chloroflexota bacterium]
MAPIPTYLADTSAFTHARWREVVAVLQPLIDRDLVATCGMVDLEVSFTARNAEELRAMRAMRRMSLERIETEDRDFERAIDVFELLSARGLHRAAKVNDLLIAAVAERAGLTVLHYDQDFDYIGEVTGQAMEWIAPKGSL